MFFVDTINLENFTMSYFKEKLLLILYFKNSKMYASEIIETNNKCFSFWVLLVQW